MLWFQKIFLTLAGLTAGAVSGTMLASLMYQNDVYMFLDPQEGVFMQNEMITVNLLVRADTPVNVFSGEVNFDPKLLFVESIDYNTSLADLWALEPWYENGAGTLQFAGGTTRPGGFVGEEKLISVNFKALGQGEASLKLHNAHILAHDGFGTEIPLTDHPIDALFTLAPEKITKETIFWKKETSRGSFSILAEVKTTDINHDGKTNILDLSIFMIDLVKGGLRSDFNGDGKVNTKDLSIILDSI